MSMFCCSWNVSSGDPIPTDALNLSEDIPNPDALYHTLDMFGEDEMSGTHSQQQPPAYSQSHSQHSSQQHQPRGKQAFFRKIL